MTDMPAAAGSGRSPGRAGPGLIHRHDLMAALNQAARKRVTVISAPAGTGKTSLLRAWANEPGQDCRIAFMTVRPGQHDMQLFWLTMLGAVRAAASADRGLGGGPAARRAVPRRAP
jgi:LuxR family maltose regulon positive regulatory protein